MASDWKEIINDSMLRRMIGEVTGVDPMTGECLDNEYVYDFDDRDMMFLDSEY